MTIDEYISDSEMLDSYNKIVLPDAENKNFENWSVYPFIARDFSLWTDSNTKPEDVSIVIKENMGDSVLVGPTLIDQFEKDNRKSYAFRVVFQSFEKPLQMKKFLCL